VPAGRTRLRQGEEELPLRDLIIEGLRIIAPLSVALIVFAEALQIAPSKVFGYLRDRPLVMLRALVAALVLVPAAALTLILLLDPAPALAIGLAILVACPPAPLMLKNAAKIGGGDPAFIATLHLSLAGLAIVTVPAVLNVLAIPLGFSSNAGVDPAALLSLLGKTILIPIAVGLAVRTWLPGWADRLGTRAGKLGSIGLLVVVLALLGALFPALLNMDAWSYAVIAAVTVAALAIGHLLGPRNAAEKTVLAVECAVRHPGLAVSIGATNFTPQQALPVLLPCALLSIVIATAYLVWRGRSAQRGAPLGA
jgi:predicted Na+-dependent transporter